MKQANQLPNLNLVVLLPELITWLMTMWPFLNDSPCVIALVDIWHFFGCTPPCCPTGDNLTPDLRGTEGKDHTSVILTFLLSVSHLAAGKSPLLSSVSHVLHKGMR